MRRLAVKRDAALDRYVTRGDRASRWRLRFWDFLLDLASLNGRL